MSDKALPETARFLKVVHELRTQCPWDKKQTHKTLRPYLLEETYELLEALDGDDADVMCEELGDLLLQICLHSEIASESKGFDFEKVAKLVADKMIARHPHVYGETKVKDEHEVKANWMKLKQKEKPDRKLLDGIPKALPALLLALKYGYRAANAGFDWSDQRGVLEKVGEETRELLTEMDSESPKQEALQEEFGDLLFTLVQLARHLKLDAEAALRESCQKFAHRIEKMESVVDSQGKKLQDLKMDELEALWNEAKKKPS